MDEFYEIFPTPVALYRYKDSIDTELNYLKSIKYLSKDDETLTNRSMNSFLFEKEELKDIYVFVNKCLKDYARRVLATDQLLTVTQSWSNRNIKGAHHHDHVHPNSIVSGVFYFQTNSSTPIIFNKTDQHAFVFEPIKFNTVNSHQFKLEVEAGECILFPSSLRHAVPENNYFLERISMSFNTFSLGTLGSKRALTHLNIKELVEDKNNENT